MYASANSCVDRLNIEGVRDPASRLTQIADKEGTSDAAETDEQKQERLEKRRREIGADLALCSACQWKMRTCATTADKDTRLQCLSAQTEPCVGRYMPQVHDSGVRDHPINEEAIWPSQLLYKVHTGLLVNYDKLSFRFEQ